MKIALKSSCLNLCLKLIVKLSYFWKSFEVVYQLFNFWANFWGGSLFFGVVYKKVYLIVNIITLRHIIIFHIDSVLMCIYVLIIKHAIWTIYYGICWQQRLKWAKTLIDTFLDRLMGVSNAFVSCCESIDFPVLPSCLFIWLIFEVINYCLKIAQITLLMQFIMSIN